MTTNSNQNSLLFSEVLKQQKIEQLKLQSEKLRRICHNSFYNFFCNAWEVVWPGIKLHENWHYAELAKEVELQTAKIIAGEDLDYEVLVVNVPFRTAKSTFFTICWNAWAWLHSPSLKFVSWSHIESLAVDHSFRTRKLIESLWYRTVMKPKFYLTGDQNTKSNFENNKGGFRKALSVCRGLGEGGDIHLVDDPISREDALSEVIRKGVNSWLFETLPTRRNDQRKSLIALIMQRIHQNDPTGEVITRKDGMTYKFYCLPSDIEPGVKVYPPRLKKRYVNGVMFDTAFPKTVLIKLKNTLGSYTFNAQCRQMPSPPEGGIFNRKWWKFWVYRNSNLAHYTTQLTANEIFTHEQVNVPVKFDDTLLSADLGFKKTIDSSRVAFGKWGKIGTDKFLLDVIVGRMDYVETKKRVVSFYSLHKKEASRFLIEDKANGPAVISDLSTVIPILIGKNPGQESKVKRASVVTTAHAVPMSAQCEAGHIYIPHPSLFPWVTEFIDEFAMFPNGSTDDLVDMSTQAINYWSVNDGDIGLYTNAQYQEKENENDPQEDEFVEIIRV
jgi:predicted phage terminase large subunit-like protein